MNVLERPTLVSNKMHGYYKIKKKKKQYSTGIKPDTQISGTQWRAQEKPSHSHDPLIYERGSPGTPASVGDARDEGSIFGLGRSPGVGNGNPLQYSCLENSIDWGPT